MNHNKLIGQIVKIKDASESEKGFGVIVKYAGTVFHVRLLNNTIVFIQPERLIVQPSRDEALNKLRKQLNYWYKSLPGCADKSCFVCTRQQNELNEGLELIDLLEVL